MNPMMWMLYGGPGGRIDPALVRCLAEKRQERWRHRLAWIIATLTSLYYLWKGVWSSVQTITFMPPAPSGAGSGVAGMPVGGGGTTTPTTTPTNTQYLEAVLAQAKANDKDRRWQSFMLPFLEGIASEIIEWVGLSDVEEHFMSFAPLMAPMAPAAPALPLSQPMPVAPPAGPARFPAGTWVSDPGENPPAVYQVDADGVTLHHIANQPVAIQLRGTGYDSTVQRTAAGGLAQNPRGAEITSGWAEGTLLASHEDPSPQPVFLVNGGQIRWIPNPTIAARLAGANWTAKVQWIPRAQLYAIPRGANMT